eukprot:m.68301 g.68301  ORF g.68301 m.68301 type:complete len:760 (+) comp11955_c0_seq4:103-2382(+)
MEADSTSESWEEFTTRALSQASVAARMTEVVRNATAAASPSSAPKEPMPQGRQHHSSHSSSVAKHANTSDRINPGMNEFDPYQDHASVQYAQIRYQLLQDLQRSQDKLDRERAASRDLVARLTRDHKASQQAHAVVVRDLEAQLEKERFLNKSLQSKFTALDREIQIARETESAAWQAARERDLVSTREHMQEEFQHLVETHDRRIQEITSVMSEKEKEALEREAELSDQLAQKNSELRELRNSVEGLKVQFRSCEDLNSALETDLEVSRQQTVDLRTTLMNVTQTNEDTVQQLKSEHEQSKVQMQDDLLSLEAQYREALVESQEQTTALRTRMSTANSQHQREISVLKQELLEVKRDTSLEVKRILDNYNAKADSATEMVHKLEGDMKTKMQIKIDVAQTEAQEKKLRCKELEEILLEKEQELSRIRLQEHNTMKEEIAKVKQDMKRASTKSIEKLKKDHAASIEQLDAMVKAATERQALLETRHKEDLQMQQTGHDAEMSRLQDEYEKEMKRLRKDLSEKTIHMEHMTKELSELQKDINERLATERRNHDEAISSQRREHGQKMAALRKEYHDEVAELINTHQDEMNNLREKLEANLRETEARYLEATTKLSQSERALAAGKSEVLALEDKLKQATSDLERAETDNRRILERERDETRNALEGNVVRLKAAEQECRRNQTQIEELEAQLQMSLADARQQYINFRKELDEARQETTRVALGYEERIKEMLPASIRGELETTIDALRAQIFHLRAATPR